MHQHTDALALELARTAQHLRLDVLDMVVRAQSGHLGGPFSCAEIVAALYFHHLRLDPARPDWPERDRFLLSQGPRGAHPVRGPRPARLLPRRGARRPSAASPPASRATPTASCRASRWSPARWATASPWAPAWPGPSRAACPSPRPRALPRPSPRGPASTCSWATASSTPASSGRAPCSRPSMRLGNLTAIVDANGIQQTGATADVMPTEPLADKWRRLRVARPGGPRPQRPRGPRRARPGRRGARPALGHHRPHDEGPRGELHGVRPPLARRPRAHARAGRRRPAPSSPPRSRHWERGPRHDHHARRHATRLRRGPRGPRRGARGRRRPLGRRLQLGLQLAVRGGLPRRASSTSASPSRASSTWPSAWPTRATCPSPTRSPSCFATRALEMIRTHCCYGGAAVKLMGAYGGVSDSFDGPDPPRHHRPRHPALAARA